jgi:hypothetical protein
MFSPILRSGRVGISNSRHLSTQTVQASADRKQGGRACECSPAAASYLAKPSEHVLLDELVRLAAVEIVSGKVPEYKWLGGTSVRPNPM